MSFLMHPRIPRLSVSMFGQMAIDGVEVKPSIHPTTGRPFVKVGGNYVYVHHAVLETFVGPRPSPDHHGLHADDNPLNNRLSNLRWGTCAENMEDRRRNNPGWSEPHPKLDATDAWWVRAYSANGMSTNELSRRFGVSHSTIRKILKRQTWKNVSADHVRRDG